MFKILAFIVIFLLVMVVIGLAVMASMVRKFIHMSNRKRTNQQANRPSDNQWASEETENTTHPHRKKIFSDDEGEYVDFEEIKT